MGGQGVMLKLQILGFIKSVLRCNLCPLTGESAFFFSSTPLQIPSDPLKPIRDQRSENKEANWSFG